MPWRFLVVRPPIRPASALLIFFLRFGMVVDPPFGARTARDGRDGPMGMGEAGGSVDARVPVPEDGFTAFLVAALEVLFRDQLFIGEDAIVVLLRGFRAGEDDE